MFKDYLKTTGLVVALLAICPLTVSAMENDAERNKILRFGYNSIDNVKTGKVIMRMIMQENPEYYVPNAEEVKNKRGGLAYYLGSHGQGIDNREGDQSIVVANYHH